MPALALVMRAPRTGQLRCPQRCQPHPAWRPATISVRSPAPPDSGATTVPRTPCGGRCGAGGSGPGPVIARRRTKHAASHRRSSVEGSSGISFTTRWHASPGTDASTCSACSQVVRLGRNGGERLVHMRGPGELGDRVELGRPRGGSIHERGAHCGVRGVEHLRVGRRAARRRAGRGPRWREWGGCRVRARARGAPAR
jgi:hypothetical protein